MTKFLRTKLSTQTDSPVNSQVSTASASNNLQDQPDNDEPKTQLKTGLPVYVKSSQLFLMKRFKNKPKELARSLLYEICGKENLANMCAKGRSKNKTAVPAEVRAAIQQKKDTKKPLREEKNASEGTEINEDNKDETGDEQNDSEVSKNDEDDSDETEADSDEYENKESEED
ncbi:uncharacterized protein LOC122498325 [Leptopilina heterotoma]|uniref:uncharacterized protein LOC122498325 n=1 Tax=Leptopilina heterotoma TaxID=63436 RepID=UPI001CA8C428|nr:uncharacterized protein LOC122498325 [Leptopilina heterotoma]